MKLMKKKYFFLLLQLNKNLRIFQPVRIDNNKKRRNRSSCTDKFNAKNKNEMETTNEIIF